MSEQLPRRHVSRRYRLSSRKLVQSAGLAAALASLCLLALPVQAAAQDRFAEVPDLVERGRMDDWRLGKLDSDDVWLGQACVLFKQLNSGAHPINVTYRFEPDELTTITFEVPQPESVPDPNAVDWGYLEPTEFIYAVSDTEAYAISGYTGWEYIDPNTVYVALSFELDAAEVDRVAASDWVGVAIRGSEDGMRFDTGRAAPAVAWARQCLAEFD